MNKNVLSIGLLALLGASTYALAKNSYALGYTQGAIDISNKMFENINEGLKEEPETYDANLSYALKRLDEVNHFESRMYAENVIDTLEGISDGVGFATVEDLVFGAKGVLMFSDRSGKLNKYGWTKKELGSFYVVRDKDNKYCLSYPIPHKLDSQE